MTEVAEAGEDHGDALLVGGGDDFGVAHRAARLDDGGGAGLGQHVEAVTEREEGIRGHHAAGDHQAANGRRSGPRRGTYHG